MKSKIFPELTGFLSRDQTIPAPQFPKQCPGCGDGIATEWKNGANTTVEVEYDCGGIYEEKPQIQSHSRIWWGRCTA